eukprot:1555656-Prymnesium_polylepis.1
MAARARGVSAGPLSASQTKKASLIILYSCKRTKDSGVDTHRTPARHADARRSTMGRCRCGSPQRTATGPARRDTSAVRPSASPTSSVKCS